MPFVHVCSFPGYVDVENMQDGSRSLSKWEIVRALVKTFEQFNGLYANDLLEGFEPIWPQLDPNNDGKNHEGRGINQPKKEVAGATVMGGGGKVDGHLVG